VIQELQDFRSQRQAARFAALAVDAQLRFRQQQIVAVEGAHFAGTQAIEEHQANDGQVPRGAEARPKPRHFLVR
jgi:hypothetical protein